MKRFKMKAGQLKAGDVFYRHAHTLETYTFKFKERFVYAEGGDFAAIYDLDQDVYVRGQQRVVADFDVGEKYRVGPFDYEVLAIGNQEAFVRHLDLGSEHVHPLSLEVDQ